MAQAVMYPIIRMDGNPMSAQDAGLAGNILRPWGTVEHTPGGHFNLEGGWARFITDIRSSSTLFKIGIDLSRIGCMLDTD